MRVLGIDPGTNIFGYAIIDSKNERLKLLEANIIRVPQNLSHNMKLKFIFEKISDLIVLYNPSVIAIESPFYGKNAQSMLKLGRAQGAAILASLLNGKPVFEYTPREIKQSVSGYGNASKEQIARMVQTILNFYFDVKTYDLTDSIAVAITHIFKSKSLKNE